MDTATISSTSSGTDINLQPIGSGQIVLEVSVRLKQYPSRAIVVHAVLYFSVKMSVEVPMIRPTVHLHQEGGWKLCVQIDDFELSPYLRAK